MCSTPEDELGLGECCDAVKFQKCVVDYETSSKFPLAWG